MNKVREYRYDYASNMSKNMNSACTVTVYTGEGLPPVIVLTDIDVGMSVTNSMEYLAYLVLQREYPQGLDGANVIIVEHYPARGREKPTYDLVSFSSTKPERDYQSHRGDRYRLGEPSWTSLTEEGFKALVAQERILKS